MSNRRMFIVFSLVALACSCDRPDPGANMQRMRGGQVQSESDHFAIAAEYLDRFAEHAPASGQRNAVYHLNQWLLEQPPAGDWEVDPLAKQLPRVLLELPLTQAYARPRFDELDGRVLWEAAMFKRISTWALEHAHDDPLLTSWYKAMEGTHGADHVHQLKMAVRLFDWTTRNIQLDPLLPAVPPQTIEGNSEPQIAPLLGIPGPGYRFEPWQVALYGRGDAWQRARVFIRLARQQQLPVVMLAVVAPAAGGSPRPWVAALLLDGQLYLFDPHLGLPLAGSDYTGIATLADLRSNPAILRQFDVAEFTYPVTTGQLSGVEVLIDAIPSELSHRMKQAEENFIGQQKLTLTVDPSQLAARLREVTGVSTVRVWPIGIETLLYRANAGAMISRNRELYRDYMVREVLFESPNPLSQGRWQHLAGNFDSEPGEKGAKQFYLEARNAEETLALMAQSPQIQRQLGMAEVLEQQPERREELLGRAEAMLRQAAHNASYWLGAISYEEGKFPVALNWFEGQILTSRLDTIWEPGAGYNVGRCYEQMQQLEQALAHYRTLEDSPALHGVLVRARWIENRFGE